MESKVQDSTTVTFLTLGHVKTLTGGASLWENEPALLPRRALSLSMYISPSLSREGTNTGVKRAEEIESRSAYHLHGKPGNFQLENQMVRIIPFGVLLKLWASGQSDAFLLLLLGYTADVHTFCMSSVFC